MDRPRASARVWPAVRRLIGDLDRSERSTILALVLLEGVTTPATVAGVHYALERVLHEPRLSIGAAFRVAAILALVAIVQRTAGEVKGAATTLFGLRATRRGLDRLLTHVGTMSGAELDDPGLHDIVSRAMTGVESGTTSALFAAAQVVSSMIGAVGTISVVALINPLTAALIACSAVPAVLAQRLSLSRIQAARLNLSVAQRQASHLAGLAIHPATLPEIQSNGLAASILDLWSARWVTVLARYRRVHLQNAGTTVLGLAGTCALLLPAFVFVLRSGGSSADVAASLTAVGLISAVIGFFVQAYGTLSRAAIVLDDVFTVLARRPTVQSGPVDVRPPGPLRVQLDAVSFSYAGRDTMALTDVTLELEPGTLVALVGENGAGKSTVVRLLSRLYDPTEGTVRMNGDDVRTFSLSSYRAQFGFLLQDPIRWNLTVAQALVIGRAGSVTTEQLWAALGDVGLAGTFAALDGLDTQLGRLFPGGTDLSGGQWQRLAIARLLIMNPPIWILDEPTSFLDPRAEREIVEVLRSRLGTRAGLVISHRFPAVRAADCIVVLSHGRVLGCGTHEQLLAERGLYWSTFQAQAAAFA